MCPHSHGTEYSALTFSSCCLGVAGVGRCVTLGKDKPFLGELNSRGSWCREKGYHRFRSAKPLKEKNGALNFDVELLDRQPGIGSRCMNQYLDPVSLATYGDMMQA